MGVGMKVKPSENTFAQFLRTLSLVALIYAAAGFATGHLSTHTALAMGLIGTSVAIMSTQTMLERD
jgi:hypothetical protein